MRKSSNVKFLGNVYKDIMNIKWEDNDNLNNMYAKFYRIMSKYGICQGVLTKTGSRLINTPEWSMCLMVFRQCMNDQMTLKEILSDDIPEELLNYI